MHKPKFTIIDAGIIVLVIALIIIGISVLGGKFGSAGEKKEVYFTVLIQEVNEGTSQIINAGDKVSISHAEEAFATVVSASEVPYEKSELNEAKGVYLTHQVEGKSDVKIFLKCDAQVTDTKISNGNVPIRVGEEMPVYGKGYSLNGYVVEIEEK